jgi:hypothetical protein
MGRECSTNMLVGEFEGKIQLGKPRRIWEDNIKLHPREID